MLRCWLILCCLLISDACCDTLLEDGQGLGKAVADVLWALSPEPEDNPECARHTRLFREHLANNTLWAVQMAESSALAASGVLSGATDHLGHYDSCLGVRLEAEELAGRYCLATIHLEPAPHAYPTYHDDHYRADPFSLHYPPHLSVWDKMKTTPDPSKKTRDVLKWALCVPDSCRPRDLAAALDTALTALRPHGIQARALIPEHSCTAATDPSSPGIAYYCIRWLLIASLSCVVVATLYDMLFYRNNSHRYNPKGNGVQTMLVFSVYENLCTLTRPDRSTDLAALHGLRTYAMILIILGHRCLFSYGSPMFNPEFLEERYRKFSDILLLNGTLVVDAFFMFSGFLTCHFTLIELDKSNKLRLTAIYVLRWLRITPLYMLMVTFYAGVLPYLGDGPLWKLKAGLEADRCRKNWWTNLLNINNYVNTDQICMFQSWYISCDMHYSLAAPLVVFSLWRRPWAGLLLLSIIFLLASAIPFLVTYFGRYDGVLRVYMSVLENPMKTDIYRNVYIKSHIRATPYVIGIAAGYLYRHLRAIGFKFTVAQLRVGLVLAATAALGSQISAWFFYIPGRAYHPLENALYSSLHRVGYSIGIAWIVIASGTSGFGVMEQVLGLKTLVPLSRLTYNAFLVHGMVQLYTVSTLRNAEYMSFPKLYWMWLGDVSSSFLLALVMYLLLEAPLNGLLHMCLLSKGKPNETDKKRKTS